MPKMSFKVKRRLADKATGISSRTVGEGRPLQYRKVIENPDWKPERGFLGRLKKLDEPVENEPIIDNGKVPVHRSCETCSAWLEAYAKILDGHFVGVVEVQVDGEPKELVLIKPETTAKALREEYERRLSHLQESCSHEIAEWAEMQLAPGHTYGRGRVCLRCERIMETDEEDRVDPIEP